MLSIPFATENSQRQSDCYSPSGAITHDLSSVFSQPVIGVPLDNLLDKLRYERDKAEFAQDRPMMASVILLGHALSCVPEAEMDECVTCGWEAVLKLYRESKKRIVNHLAGIAANIAETGINTDESVVNDSYSTLEIEVSKNDGGYVLLLDGYLHYSNFDLLPLDRSLGRAVYGCLMWIIRSLGFGIMANDLIDFSYCLEDEQEGYKNCRHAKPELSNAELAQWALEMDVFPFNEMGDDAQYLAERFGYLQSLINNSVENTFGNVPEMEEIRAWVIRCRQESRDTLYSHPWLRFIRRTVTIWKAWQNQDNPDNRQVFETGDCNLDMGHVIGLGFDWEEDLVEGLFQGIGQSGETPGVFAELSPNTVDGIAKALTDTAQAKGLIRLAEIISFQN